ncbi:MAG: hypothetical protein UY09_C0028G0016 [Parcubacteria group bacterium GW2011_GWA2_47_8]|nr:MAG: hypothetical protein UY09_C0028G0016 [Parcubacteria group bacterium GW2011_GWA2_47_8]OHB20538.1 MAG: hypothetical protein A2666_03685 [Parcubacteria group bacterium RIFCSPHIGHO2_01_FULL_47_10b]
MSAKHPYQRVSVLIDVQNLYHSAKHLHKAKVDFKKVIDKAVGGRQLIRAIAYVVTTEGGEEEPFIKSLEKQGIEIRSKPLQIFAGGMKKADWDVGLAIDAIKLSQSVDAIILLTGDGDFVHLVRYLKNNSPALVEVAAFRKSSSSALVAEADDFMDIGGDDKRWFLIK